MKTTAITRAIGRLYGLTRPKSGMSIVSYVLSGGPMTHVKPA